MKTSAAARRYVKQVGSNIREARKARGLSQTALGRKLSTDAPTVSRFESGTRDARVSELFDLGRALDVPPAEFLKVAGRAE